MVKGTGSTSRTGLNRSVIGHFDENIGMIRLYSYMSIAGLIISVLLITFELRLIAGIIIIATACLILILLKKMLSVSEAARNSLNDVSSSSEKKDDVITDFSHKIREPLNNLVIITDLLMESGLQKQQKELLETFVASTNNMVTTVNELTMQSAGSLSLETRKDIRFNLLSTIQNTIELYSLKEKANIDFILSKKEFADYECIGDPIVLKQIFLDLFNTIENQNSERTTKVTIGFTREKESENESLIGFRIQTDKKIILINEKELVH
ncbi:MAG: HAMP domain-containing histidine kinase, partial [Bacteroidales bacterium]|nr:HAMP domain-containing histidine kinase [Bacteroidales bacterium]